MKKIARYIFFLYREAVAKVRSKWVMSRCGGCSGRIRVNGATKLTKNTFLGSNVNFNGLVITGGGKVTIGDNFHSGPDCLLIPQNHNFDAGSSIPYDNTNIYKDINISSNVWIGSRVIILGGVSIGEGAIIQAGSCVVNDIPPHAIAGGHPARVFSHRNIDHYESLKAQGRFN